MGFERWWRYLLDERGIALFDDNSIEFAEQKGIEKGIKIGEEKNTLENARSLKALGVDIEIIAQALGLPTDDVHAL